MGYLSLVFAVLVALPFIAEARHDSSKLYSIKVEAKNKVARDRVSAAGVAIDAVYSDSVGVIGTENDIESLKKAGLKFESIALPEHRWSTRGFPASDAAFHDFAENMAAIDDLVAKHPDIAQKISIGKSLEGRDLVGVRLSSNPTPDSLPTAIFMGCHHAREHLSVEVPLKIAQYLATNYRSDSRIRALLDGREIWIVPMINPDGAEHDIASGSYKYWRKNRRKNADGTYGVDLNRNYGTGFGGPGSSAVTTSDIYHGPSAFSEPETAAVRDFVRLRKKATVLLSFHTFSELVLWPWGHTENEITSDTDRAVFETMGRAMAKWNKYTPQKSSDLYVASGDTTDWAYDELRLFAFTFELSPSSLFAGGFYPGAKAIEPTFQANLEPALYLIDNADDPYRVTNASTDPLHILD